MTATGPTTDLFFRILHAVAARVEALAIDGIGSHVYMQLVPDEAAGLTVAGDVSDVVFPCVLLTLDADAETRSPEDTGTKGWTMPVRMWIADKNPQHNHARIPLYLGARKALFDAFDEIRGDAANDLGVPEIIRLTVTPEVRFDPRLPNYQHLVSGMLLTVETEEARA